MFSLGLPSRRPASSRPLLMQMASSPTSKWLSVTRQSRQLSRSRPSPFWLHQGFRHRDVPHGHAIAQQRVEVPAGRILEGRPVQQHVAALGQLQQARPQVRPSGLVVLDRDRSAAGVQLLEIRPAVAGLLRGPPDLAAGVGHATGGQQFGPLLRGHLGPLHRAPGLALPVEDALARDGHVAEPAPVDRGGAANPLGALKGCLHQRVVGIIAAEQDRGPGLDVQLHAALETDRTGQIRPGRDDHLAAASRGRCLDGLGDSLGVLGLRRRRRPRSPSR